MPEALRSRGIRPGDVDRELREQLFALYDGAYAGGSRSHFESDLDEKDWIILLQAGKAVAGFSTQKIFPMVHEGEPVRILFSGDTIIAPHYWGSQELVRAWCRFAGAVKSEEPDTRLFWYLISKGHRTYLYLPIFFDRFHPSCFAPPSPREERLMHALGRIRYGERYDASTGLIDAGFPHDRLRTELDSTPSRTRNPHVSFFLQRNPQYARGVELLCMAEIAAENMRGMARRELDRGMADGLRELAV